MTWVRAALLASFAGCYRPSSEAACSVSCGADMACPAGESCDFALGPCHPPNVSCRGVDAGGTTDARTCFGQSGGLLQACLMPLPTMPVTFTGTTTVNTDTSPQCRSDFSAACVIAATTIDVSGTLVANGARPLVLVATDAIAVEASGTIDVASYTGRAAPPAGVDSTACGTPPAGAAGGVEASGGAGGSFGTLGGSGGSTNGIPAVSPNPTSPVTTVRGGCSGGSGAGPGKGAGGGGGGAIYLIAGASITVDGHILAYGQGGKPGACCTANGPWPSGGGGGAGGLIGLDAPTIKGMGGTLVADGGGGGGGSTYTNNGLPPGVPGQDGTIGGSAGGHGAGASGNVTIGGNGATTNAPGTKGGNGGINAAGGGGGGAGVILLIGDHTKLTATIAPS